MARLTLPTHGKSTTMMNEDTHRDGLRLHAVKHRHLLNAVRIEAIHLE